MMNCKSLLSQSQYRSVRHSAPGPEENVISGRPQLAPTCFFGVHCLPSQRFVHDYELRFRLHCIISHPKWSTICQVDLCSYLGKATKCSHACCPIVHPSGG